MNWLKLLLARACATAFFAGFGAAVSQAAAPILPVCSWPFEVTGQGITNIATLDTNATYCVMPLDLTRWRAIVIYGQYPDARFFNFSTYTATGSFIDSVFDEEIVPDPGSTNPFAEPGPGIAGNYTVTIGTANPGSGNFLSAGEALSCLLCIASICPTKAWTEPPVSVYRRLPSPISVEIRAR